MGSVILANVVRGETIESIHRGHFIALDRTGKVFASAGDSAMVTYFRSAAKPFQALPMITSGAADAFGFTETEIAMVCASHSGEPVHVEAAAAMLSKIGLNKDDLHCGTHAPFYTPESHRLLREGIKPSELHNNCSGKHTGMLAFARYTGADIANYEDISNPIQQTILDSVSAFAGVPVSDIQLGVDGCAVPTFAMPLAGMARCFANLVSPSPEMDVVTRSACGRIVKAMHGHPEIIGGTERLDTLVMQAAPEKLISKVGAEGVWLCGVLPSDCYPNGLGIALKIEDGDDLYSRAVVAVELLRQLSVIGSDALSELSPHLIKNRRGDVVGRIVSAFQSFN